MKSTVKIPVEEHEKLKAENARLKEQLAWYQRQVFGQKSERLTDMPGDTPDIPGLEIPSDESATPETVEVPSHKRKKKSGKGEFKIDLPDWMERVEVAIDPPENERILPDGRQLVRIDEERVEKLAYRGTQYYAKVFVKGIWALPGEKTITPVQEPMPDDLAHGSKLDTSFMAHIAVEKFQFHMPLNRMVEKLNGMEVGISDQLLSQTLIRCGGAVKPLADRMMEQVLNHPALFTDDTPIKLFQKKKCREARIWVYAGGKAPPKSGYPPYIVYQFTENRRHEHPKKLLKNYDGVIHADAFGAYEGLDGSPDYKLQWAACWAHARRRHFEAEFIDSNDRLWILKKIRYLFMFERVAWNREPGERLRIRDEKERPIVKEIFGRLKALATDPKLLPKSKQAEAISYMLHRVKNFTLYLDNADVRMDNNHSERNLRKLTIGRRNWNWLGSKEAGTKQMALLSLIQTCRHLEINPQEYLDDIFARVLTHPASRIDELLPDQWKRIRDEKSSQEN